MHDALSTNAEVVSMHVCVGMFVRMRVMTNKKDNNENT